MVTKRASRLRGRGWVLSLLVVAGASACKSTDQPGAGPSDGGPDAQADSGNPSPSSLAALGFQASNLPPTAGPANSVGNITLAGECVINGDTGKIECSSGNLDEGYGFALLEQTDPDHSKVAAFFVRSLRVETAAEVLVGGAYSVALIAWDTVRINGTISATVDGPGRTDAQAGGFSGRQAVGAGAGPGAGGAPSLGEKVGAGGGGYCGRGGPGGGAAGPGSNGGTSYGNDRLSPLLGGSSGGTNEFAHGSGGGGAVQIVAGVSIDVGTTGVLSAAGGGGASLGGGGAGSGGAMLLEAPTVRMAGVIAVNGGGGGGNTLSDSGLGESGRPDGIGAKGGVADNAGGAGSAGASIDGGPGTYTGGAGGGVVNTGGAGGGGAGRIRINTASGTADMTGTLSPSAGPCATVGKI